MSVLFADLVGSTATAEQLDPEDVRALQEPYWQHVRSEIARHGGTLEKFIGDAVVALFGAPLAREDDAERAVRAALEIQKWAREQHEIQVRIGITTGEALVRLGADPRAGEGMASGDVVNTASRLQAAARANTILVDETTRRATRELIDYSRSEPVVAKGKAEPIPVWEAHQAHSRFGVDVVHYGRTPLVGRELELDLLKAALKRVREDRSPQLVTLVGVPGIGKSRLVYELMQAVVAEPEIVVRWRQGRSLPYGDGVAFWALSEIVKAEAGILESDSDAEAEAKLARAVTAVGHEADWVLRHLRPLLGRGHDVSVGDQRDASFTAWRLFLESLAEQRPSVFVFEDLHWADDGLLDFIDHLVDWASAVPMLVVCTARPELLERRPAWAGGKLNTSTLALAPLKDDETAALLHALLEGTTQSEREWAILLEHSGGHPLYAEQFALLVREHGSLEGVPLPETLQGIIAARLDALPVDEKLLLQDAAVVGKVFWSGALPALATAPSRALHTLERKEFVQREPQSIVEGEEQYAFRHVLVRDVAYAQIPRFNRAAKHLEVAKWIESLARSEDHAETVAHHYLAALEYVRAAGGDISPFREPAKEALKAAGSRALTLNANTTSAAFFGAALELAPGKDELPELFFCYGKALARTSAPDEHVLARARDAMLALGDAERAAECEVILAELLWRRGEREQAFGHLRESIAMLEEGPPSPARASALSTLSRFRMAGDEPEEALELAQASMLIADELGLDDLHADALITIGLARVANGDRRGLDDLERSIEIADEANSPQSIRGNFNLAGMLANLGDLRRARTLYSRGYRLAERFGDAAWIEFFEAERVYQHYWSGEWESALTLAEQLIGGADTAARRPQLDGWLVRGWIALARGDVALALEASDHACALSREAGDPQDLYPALAFRARTLVSDGQYAEAWECASELLRLLRERPSLPSFWAIDLAIALRKLERGDELRKAIPEVPSTRWLEAATAYVAGDAAAAATICAEIGARPEAAYAHLEAARIALAAARRADAEAELASAQEFFTAVGAASSSDHAETLLTN